MFCRCDNFESEKDALDFFNFLNTRHPNIKFTKEYNKDGVLPFLDVSISNKDSVTTSVYHKPTYTGLLTNFKSFVPYEYKTRLVSTLLDRTYKINSSLTGFDLDVQNLCKCLLRNLYPKRLFDKILKRFLEQKRTTDSQNESSDTNDETRYIKLPYIGELSKTAKYKISCLLRKFCKENIKVRVVLTTCKIGSYFSTKDVMPECFRSSVVYKFYCAGCKSCYVGRTHVHFNTRRWEHLETDVGSAVYKHIREKRACKNVNSFESFSILDNAKTDYELALKAAMHIKWLKPSLNGQKKHVIIKLLI